jgi:hypothetical protein
MLKGRCLVRAAVATIDFSRFVSLPTDDKFLSISHKNYTNYLPTKTTPPNKIDFQLVSPIFTTTFTGGHLIKILREVKYSRLAFMMDVSNGFHVKLPPRNPNNYDKCVQSSFGKYSGTIRVFPPKTQLNVLMIVDHQDSNSRRKCHFLNLSRFISAVTFFQSTCKRRLHG